jgi:hypothetical protein
MRLIKRAVGTGVGLTAEAIEHQKQKSRDKKAAAAQGQADPLQETGTVAGPSTGFAAQGSASGPAHHDHKAVAKADSDSEDSVSSLEDDDEAWELDEALSTYEEAAVDTSHLSPEEKEEQEKKEKLDTPAKVKNIIAKCGPPPYLQVGPDGETHGPLPCPVILPQRRPKNKQRGFVRAYAPVLENAGIGQEAFLQFLNDWNASATASNSLPSDT